jgi:hypothetical protein
VVSSTFDGTTLYLYALNFVGPDASARELLRLERTRFISGRPRKRKPPDLTAFLPGFPA